LDFLTKTNSPSLLLRPSRISKDSLNPRFLKLATIVQEQSEVPVKKKMVDIGVQAVVLDKSQRLT